MIRFLKQHESSIIVLGPLVFFLDWLVKWYTGWNQPYEWAHRVFFIDTTIDFLNSMYPLRHTVHGVLAVFTGFYVNRIFQGHNLLRRISNFPLLLYFALAMTIPPGWESIEIWVGVLLVTRALQLLLTMIDNEKAGTHVFDASLLICLASLIFKPVLVFLVVIYGACYYANVLNWRTLIVPVTALIIVAYFTWALLFITGNDPGEVFSFLFAPEVGVYFGITLWQKMIFVLITLAVMIGLAGLGQIINRSTIKNRKKWFLIILYGAAVVVGYVIYPSVFWMSYLIAVTVMALLIGNMLLRLEKWKAELYGAIILLVVCLSQISHAIAR